MKLKATFAILLTLTLFGCSREKGPIVVPDSLFFVLKHNNVRLDDQILDNIRLYYYRSGVKTYVIDFTRATEEGYNLGVITTRRIGDYSADENIKDYYLEFPNSDIDTLFVDYKHLKQNEAFNNPCYCYYPLQAVKFNGVNAIPDPSITLQKVYRFDK
jgi:hypothetical protein